MSNPLDPEVMSSAIGGLGEAASLLARGILRRRLRAADGRKPALTPSAPLRANSAKGLAVRAPGCRN
jgi:hypothetical protein